ncbi:MAG: ATP-binding protein, partial [Candidatus Muiribacteriota bacterium]
MFINREKELESLEKEYSLKKSSFVVVYGRRRVGKTELLKQFIKNKKSVYYMASQENSNIQIKRFQELCAQNLNNELLSMSIIDNFYNLFKIIAQNLKEKHVIVIDEFQYIIQQDKSLTSIFQKIWDEILINKNIMLVICGSYIGMMEDIALNYNSPLYGRRTMQIKLAPMKFSNARKFYSDISVNNQIEFYSITGGIPKYCQMIQKEKSLEENFKEIFLNKFSFLYTEPYFLLKEEINEPAVFFSILAIISQGDRKIGNIAKKMNMPVSNLTSFIKKLILLEILERKVPVLENNPEKSKKGLYFIKDYYLRFWFRFIFPNQSFVENDNYEYVIEKIQTQFKYFISEIYEDVCCQYMLENNEFKIIKAGRYWEKDIEIDIIALSEKKVYICECKWQEKKVDEKIFFNLKEKTRKLKFKQNLNIYYVIFSKNGFEENLIKLTEKENLKLIK